MTTIKITREKNYPVSARPGPLWRWSYLYSIDGAVPCQYGTGIQSLRTMLKHKHPDAQVVETWK